MIESIVLGLGCFALGVLTSLIMTSIALSGTIKAKILEDRVLQYNLPKGKSIQIWKGFVFPDNYYVCACDKYGNLNGDGVTFDKKGNIIQTDIHEK